VECVVKQLLIAYGETEMTNHETRRMRDCWKGGGFEPLEPRRMMASSDPRAVYSTFVDATYQDLLGRTADPEALAFWTQTSQLEFARLPLAQTLAHSAEYSANLVRHDYQQFLGRTPEPGALAYWTAQLQHGLADEQFEAFLLASDEFYADSGGDNASWLAAVYQQALGRPADAGGAAHWNGRLASGASRLEAAHAIAASNEHARREVAADFQHYFGRTADEGALATFAAQLTTSLAHEEFIARLVATDEYFERQTGVSPTIVPIASPFDATMNPSIAAQLQQQKPDVLFLGDSITWGWQNFGAATWNKFYAARNALNAGVPADTTQNVLWRLAQYDFAAVHPRLAIIAIGTNNLGGDSPRAIAEGVAAIVDKLHHESPTTKILVLGIFPRGVSLADPFRVYSAATNQAIRQSVATRAALYLDLAPAFLRSDGALNADFFLTDGEHLNAKGYQAWANAMESVVEALLK
jgi:beta-glucosidase